MHALCRRAVCTHHRRMERRDTLTYFRSPARTKFLGPSHRVLQEGLTRGQNGGPGQTGHQPVCRMNCSSPQNSDPKSPRDESTKTVNRRQCVRSFSKSVTDQLPSRTLVTIVTGLPHRARSEASSQDKKDRDPKLSAGSKRVGRPNAIKPEVVVDRGKDPRPLNTGGPARLV